MSRAVIAVLVILGALLVAVCWFIGRVVAAFRSEATP
jgi:hypothetical protein